jgi:hypothetical protein
MSPLLTDADLATLLSLLAELDVLTMGCGYASRVIRQDFTMADAKGFDPTLLAESQRDEKSQFDQFGIREMAVQLFPKRSIGDVGIPDDCAGVGQGDFFPFGELIRGFETEQFIVILFRQPLPSSLDGTLDASILAVNRL